jgi:hypothetical protein
MTPVGPLAAASDSLEVLLQFSFLAVLYLFLAWVVRSALRDLRRPASDIGGAGEPVAERSGPERAWLVTLGGGGLDPGTSFELHADRDSIVIGRSHDCDIGISDSYASGKHLRLELRNGAVYLEDLQSTNGTFLNGERLTDPVELRPEDVIRIGDTEFRYEE